LGLIRSLPSKSKNEIYIKYAPLLDPKSKEDTLAFQSAAQTAWQTYPKNKAEVVDELETTCQNQSVRGEVGEHQC
jgi:hypothetical protein